MAETNVVLSVINTSPPPKSILSVELYSLIMSINLGVICQLFAIFGTITNIINIIIFVKQGFSDTVNISLLALTISDLCSLLAIMWTNLCYTQAFRDADTSLLTTDVHLITGSWPHVIFTRTSAWITAFISFERCMCVIKPLKVKTMFTRKKIIISVVTLFTITLSCGGLIYVPVGLGWKFFPEKNRTLIGLVFRLDGRERNIANYVSYGINGAFMPVGAFITLSVFTAVLVVNLNKKAAWRNVNSSVMSQKNCDGDGKINTKDAKAAKMVLFISIIFIICLFPAVTLLIIKCTDPRLGYDGIYNKLSMVIASVSFNTEVINSGINIFVYFSMSTKYRETFHATFRCFSTHKT